VFWWRREAAMPHETRNRLRSDKKRGDGPRYDPLGQAPFPSRGVRRHRRCKRIVRHVSHRSDLLTALLDSHRLNPFARRPINTLVRDLTQNSGWAFGSLSVATVRLHAQPFYKSHDLSICPNDRAAVSLCALFGCAAVGRDARSLWRWRRRCERWKPAQWGRCPATSTVRRAVPIHGG
ncbi:MAG: hypothetical protein RL291_2079, partial [Pseudomonadota bacterium]